MTVAKSVPMYGQTPTWNPSRPRLRPLRLLLAWVVSAATLLVAAWIVPGAAVVGDAEAPDECEVMGGKCGGVRCEARPWLSRK